MIFCLDGQTFVGGVTGRALGYSPGFESAIDGEAEVVVEASCGMLLDYENIFSCETGCGGAFEDRQFRIRQALGGRGRLGRLLDVAGRFRRPIEAALAPVFFQLFHRGILTHRICFSGKPYQ